jgi:ubiquinol-cytochrome c reductase cytochrome b/c1 subunit
VITNLFSAFPLVGESIVQWLWGGFSVDNPTLNRFFALHYLLPFIIIAVVALHVVALHVVKSNNPDGIEVRGPQDTVPFHPYFTAKDSLGLAVFLLIFAFFVFFAPNYMGHPDNYIEANPLVTPPHIVPEWYFLPYYAILRSFVDGWWIYEIFFGWWSEAKLAGVLAMFGSLIIVAVLPWLDTSKVRSCRYRPIYKWAVILFLINFIILGWVGGKPAEEPYVTIAQGATMYYFFHFLILTPLIGWIERPKPLPASISEPVLKAGSGAQFAGASAAKMEKS